MMLGAGALICAVLLLVFFLPRVMSLRKKSVADGHARFPDDRSYPPVSVIVYSNSDAWNLPKIIPQIFDQDYPAEIEVVVVNDVGCDNTEDVVRKLQTQYSNIHLTFAPEKSRNLSRKKLAVTLGVKAAHFDTLVHTSGNCLIDSPLWLRRMLRHCAEGKKVVVGWSAVRDREHNDSRGAFMSFDAVWNSVRSLSFAINGHVVRGDANNLVYSKRLFLENKGFSRSLNLNYGDDDILVSELSTKENTAVELSAESIVEVQEDSLSYICRVGKLRRDFTSRYLPRRSFRLFSFFSVLWWLWLALAVACAVSGTPSLVPACVMVASALALFIPFMVAWRRTAIILFCKPTTIIVPLLMLLHPIYDMFYGLRGMRGKRKNFTWDNF